MSQDIFHMPSILHFTVPVIFKFFGESRIFIQIFNSTLFSLTVVLTYSIGKTLWSGEVGFYAAAMILGIPYIFSQVPLMLVDVPTMFLLTLSVYTFIKAMEKGGVWIIFSSMTVFCAIFSKYSTWMMLSVLVVIFAVQLFQNSKLKTQNSELKQLTMRAGYPGLRRWGESFTSTFLYQTHPFISISAIFSIYVAIKKRDLKFLIISWLIILIVILQIRRSRYVMLVFPMFTLMASYGLSYLKSSNLKRYIVSSIVSFSLVVAIFAYLPFLKTMSAENIHGAGNFLNTINATVVEVFTIPSDESSVNPAVSVPVLDLYTSKDIRYLYDDKDVPPLEEIKESPLRFTWEYENPEYYKNSVHDSKKNKAIVVISNGEDALPDSIKEELKEFEQTILFNTSTGIFWYAPVVTVYLPSQ